MFRSGTGRRGVRGLLALAGAGLLAGVAGPAWAGDDEVRCGDTLTQDTTLSSDLLDCPGFGLVIGADRITVDLGGHVVDGVGTGTGIRSHGYADVRIENGTVREFQTGVSLGRLPIAGGAERGDPARRNRLHGLRVVDNGTGVSFFRVFENTLADSTVADSYTGVVIVDALGGRNRVERNVVARNGQGVIFSLASSDNVVAGNRVVDSTGGGIRVGTGVTAPFVASGNTVVDNVADRNGGDGIAVAGGRENVIEGNRARRNGDDGIGVDCRDDRCAPGVVTLTGNTASRNADLGIEADAGTGDGGGNRARRNGNPAECTGVACR